MSEYEVKVHWERGEQAFTDSRYSRGHTWEFDGGVQVPTSSSPQVVRPPYSDERAVDPEEAFVAALSGCHMLWFLSIAAGRGFRIDSYTDQALGVMEKDANGREWMARVTLRPKVIFSGERKPTREEMEAIHAQAQEACFIANSVKTEVRCEPVVGD